MPAWDRIRRATLLAVLLACGLAPAAFAQFPQLPPINQPPPEAGSNYWLASPPPAESQRVPLQASWTEGLRLDSSDNHFRLHLGGDAQVDSTWLMGPDGNFLSTTGGPNGVGNSSATLLRRVRFRADGEIYDQIDFVLEYDLANTNNDNDGQQPASFGSLDSSPTPADVWMQIRDVPCVGNVRIGYQKKPIGLINNTSHLNQPFMERPDVADAFYAPFDKGRAIGVSFRDWACSERLTWQYGIYRPLTNVFAIALNKCIAGGRVTWLPYYAGEGEELIHVGLGVLGGDLVENRFRLRARPLLRNAPGFAVPILADTGLVPAQRQCIVAPEFVLVYGPWTVQAEVATQALPGTVFNGQRLGTTYFSGGYVQVLYFLTGEYQPYVKRDGILGRVIPLRNYHWRRGMGCEGPGAWQIGLRCGYLDLDNKAIRGGTLHDCTLGLNWFLNPNAKIQLNCILERREVQAAGASGYLGGIGIRAAYDF